MERMIFIALGLAALSFSSSVYAQSNAEIIERALTAAPGRAREGASVIKWNADYTYETLKEGTSQLVCFDRSGEPGQRPFAVHCTSKGNLDRAAQNRRFAAESADAEALQAMHRASEADGTRVQPEFGSVFISRTAMTRRVPELTRPSPCRAPPPSPSGYPKIPVRAVPGS